MGEEEISFGQNCAMTDEILLSIQAPAASVRGPHVVVYKNTTNRFAIVAAGWADDEDDAHGSPGLAIRWFYGPAGYPAAFGNPVWFVIPRLLSESIMDGLYDLGEVSKARRNALKIYFRGAMTGQELNAVWPTL